MKSVNWDVSQEVKQALELLQKWSPMDVVDALELLTPAFTHPAVRKYAVTRLRHADDEVSYLVRTMVYVIGIIGIIIGIIED